jgi:hypothetical protein
LRKKLREVKGKLEAGQQKNAAQNQHAIGAKEDVAFAVHGQITRVGGHQLFRCRKGNE